MSFSPMMSLIGWDVELVLKSAAWPDWLLALLVTACLGSSWTRHFSPTRVVVRRKSCSSQLCLHSSGTLRDSPSCFPQLICKAVAAVKYQPLAQSPDYVVRSVYNTEKTFKKKIAVCSPNYFHGMINNAPIGNGLHTLKLCHTQTF